MEKAQKNSVNSIDELQRVLGDNDIGIFLTDIDKDDLKAYRKATDREIELFSQIIGYVPGIVKDAKMKKAFNEAIDGSFRVVIPEGLHLGNSHTRPGALKASLYDINNHAKGPADLVKNSTSLELTKIPDFVNAAFGMASFFTGQYFMNQIDKQMSEINSKLNKILSFLQDDKIADINAAMRELFEIQARLQYVRKNSESISFTLNRVEHIQSIARKNIIFYEVKINDCIEDIKSYDSKSIKKDSYEKIKTKIKELLAYLELYERCHHLYSQTKLLEIGIMPMGVEEIMLYKQEIHMSMMELSGKINEVEDSLSSYVSAIFSDKKFREDIIDLVGGVAAFFTDVAVKQPTVTKLVTPYIHGNKVKNENKRVNIKSEYKNRIEEVRGRRRGYDQYEKSIDSWIEGLSKPMEFIRVNGDYYTNIPIDKYEFEVEKQKTDN